MKTIDEMLKDLKGRHGIGASEVAEFLGVSKVAVSRLRNGTLVLSREKMDRFREYYETQMADAPAPPRARGDRDATIVRMAALGHDYSEIGRVFELSRERVRQIVSRHGAPPRRR